MSKVLRYRTCLLGLILLAGCGGREAAPPSQLGRAVVTVQFPQMVSRSAAAPTSISQTSSRGRQQAGSGVPVGAVAVRIQLIDPASGQNLAPPQVIAAPTSGSTATAQFQAVRVGPARVIATAHPDVQALQSPLASGQADTTIQVNSTAQVILALLPTLDHLTLTVSSAQLSLTDPQSSTATVTAAALNGSGSNIAGYPLVFSVSNSSVLSIQPDPLHPGVATVRAVGSGVAAVEVREPNTGKRADVNVTVGGVVLAGLQNSPWPKLQHDNANTGRGTGAGATGVQRWVFQSSSESLESPGAIAADGTVYFAGKKLYALDGSTGATKWAFQPPPIGGETAPDSFDSGPAIGSNGAVYIASDDGVVYAVNLATGTPIWKTPIPSESFFASSVAIGTTGTIYVASVGLGYLYALDGGTGAIEWKTPIGTCEAPPALGPDGTVYIGDESSGNFYAVDGATGRIRWTFPAPAERDVYLAGAAVGSNGVVYIGDILGNFFALDAATGAVRWRFKTPAVIGSNDVFEYGTPGIGQDGTVYVGGTAGTVYALDGVTGTVKWKSPGHKGFDASPALGSDGTVYIGAENGHFYALDGSTGAQRWDFATASAGLFDCGPAIGSDGAIYFGAGTRVYAVR